MCFHSEALSGNEVSRTLGPMQRGRSGPQRERGQANGCRLGVIINQHDRVLVGTREETEMKTRWSKSMSRKPWVLRLVLTLVVSAFPTLALSAGQL